MAQCCRDRTGTWESSTTLASSHDSDSRVNTGHFLVRCYGTGSSGFGRQVRVQGSYRVTITDVPLPIRAWLCVLLSGVFFMWCAESVCNGGSGGSRAGGGSGQHLQSSSQSIWERRPLSLACVHVIDAHALLAADIAAPVKDAVTLLFALLSPGVVAAAAAQQVAALDAVWRHIADSVARPKGAGLRVGLTEVGRALVVDQVALSGVLEEGVLDPQRLHPASRLTVLLHHHLWGAVILVLQVVTQHAEVRLRPPARLHLTASWQAVTFAAQVHVVQDGLRNTEDTFMFTL